MSKEQSKHTSHIGVYLEILNDSLLQCVLFLCIFNITLHALSHHFLVVSHTSFSSLYITRDLD